MDDDKHSWGVGIALATVVAVILFLIFWVLPMLAPNP